MLLFPLEADVCVRIFVSFSLGIERPVHALTPIYKRPEPSLIMLSDKVTRVSLDPIPHFPHFVCPLRSRFRSGKRGTGKCHRHLSRSLCHLRGSISPPLAVQ